MSFSIETIASFDKQLKRLSKKYPSLKDEIGSLGDSLAIDPAQGTAIGKDCYKIRLAIKSKGKGKSGGARVITCAAIIDERVILLSIYDKSAQADISDQLLAQLRQEAGL